MSAPKDNIGFLMADVSRLMRMEFQKRIEHSAITLAQSRALVYVSRHEGIRQVDLAQLLEIQPITLARLIDQLQGEGLVERRPDPTDRRAYQLYLTGNASPKLAIIEEVAQSVREDALRGLSQSERSQLLDALGRMRQNMSSR